MAGPSAAERFDRRDFGGLVELSGSDDPHERHAAIGYLGGLRRRHVVDAVIQEQRGVAKLIKALEDDDARARVAAARALGFLGAHEAAGPLGGLLEDASSRVRARARDALIGIGHRGAADVLLRAPRRRGVQRRLDARAARPSIDLGPSRGRRTSSRRASTAWRLGSSQRA